MYKIPNKNMYVCMYVCINGGAGVYRGGGLFKAGVKVNLSEILVSLKRG